jgi:cytosine/adenosine deaminase-related metal-dependent hydrolase
MPAEHISTRLGTSPIGAPADFVAVDAETVAEAVVNRPPRSYVVKGGLVVAGTQS